jgi:valyl-tRNA synthetase
MNELSNSYNPGDFEDKIYQSWIEKGYFKSKVNPAKNPYTIVIPPPNVTGVLTMGHILNNTIQDILIRYHRMNGFEACWIPGTDHASIATEAKVAKYLSDKGIDKFKIGRDKFLEYAWEWKEKYGGIIINQLKKLGASCDWDRERFTMDDGYYKAVIHAFVDLYKKGYIYRGYRLVNWCPVSKSAISDEEVYYREVEGKLYYFKYPIKGTKEFLEIATTRPETMLGDTAVAVNPKDKRYKKVVGKKVILPIVEKEIPIIEDDYVDVEFGTGVVKITPAHDPNDYIIGNKYNLEFINILNEDATLNNNVPEEYRGLDRFEAREAVIEKMKELKLLSKIENYTHKVGYSERGHVPIEPYLSEQWFMKMEELAKPAVEALKDNKVKFYPERWTKTYFHWMENIKDWCISRQLWWGHRIPVYYCDECGYYNAYEEAPEKCERCGDHHLRQDTDVLDTWSSSWLWPFAVHNWPEIDKDLKYYYPTNTLVTAPDIIFFWVARMIMAGFEFLSDIPFSRVYFTGIVRDSMGRKMSKSLGNSPDPLDVIAEYGADALRYTITRLAPLGNDIPYSNEKCELGRNFANKIWNVARFIFQNTAETPRKNLSEVELDDFDKWILSKYNKTIEKLRADIENFHFNEAASALYDFIWSEFCDWYIEISKINLYQGSDPEKETKVAVLLHILEGTLKMLHPFMPFLTEKIYQEIQGHEETIVFSAFPVKDGKFIFKKEEKNTELIQNIIYTVRNIRGENKIPPHLAVCASIVIEDKNESALIEKGLTVIKKLGKIEKLEVLTETKKTEMEAFGAGRGFELYVSLEGIVDKEKEKEKIQKEVERLSGSREALKKKLSNKSFIEKAPKEIIEKEQSRLSYLESELEKNKKNLKGE